MKKIAVFMATGVLVGAISLFGAGALENPFETQAYAEEDDVDLVSDSGEDEEPDDADVDEDDGEEPDEIPDDDEDDGDDFDDFDDFDDDDADAEADDGESGNADAAGAFAEEDNEDANVEVVETNKDKEVPAAPKKTTTPARKTVARQQTTVRSRSTDKTYKTGDSIGKEIFLYIGTGALVLASLFVAFSRKRS